MSKGISEDILHREFAKEYIANGLNGSKAYKAIKKVKNSAVAEVSASRLLSKDRVQKHIRELLPSDDVEGGIIKDAMYASKPDSISWKDLRGYTELSLKLKGYLSTTPQGPQVNVAFIVNKNTDKP